MKQCDLVPEIILMDDIKGIPFLPVHVLERRGLIRFEHDAKTAIHVFYCLYLRGGVGLFTA